MVSCWTSHRPFNLFLPSVWREGGVERQLQPLGQLNTRRKLKRLQPLYQTRLPGSDRSPETSRETCPPSNLVFQDDLSPQGVVGVPLFRECQSMLRPLVLCLQGSRHLTGLGVGRACAGELLRVMETG